MNPNPSFDAGLWMALLYAAGAAVCVLADYLSRLAAHDGASFWNLWRWCAVCLLAMALNALLQLDVAFVLWARDVAKVDAWYALRRPLQVGVLLALAGGITLLGLRVRQDTRQVLQKQFSTGSAIAALGLALLLALLALHFVSWHYSDQLLNWRLVGLRLGRLAELAGLALILLGGLQHIVREA